MHQLTRTRIFIFYSILLIVFCIIFFNTGISFLFMRWFEKGQYYSHGLLIFLLFLFLLRRRLKETPDNEITGNRVWGTIVITISFFLYFVGATKQINTFQSLGIYIFIIGNCFLFFGRTFVFKNIGIYIYLFLAIPFPEAIIDRITFDLRLFSSYLSEMVLSFIYPSTIRSGNFLTVNGHSIIITSACSGLRNIFGMFSLIWLLALVQSNRILSLFDYLISIPAAIISNVIRILVVTILIVNGHRQFAVVEWHNEIGLFIFIIIFIIISLFNKFPFRDRTDNPPMSVFKIIKKNPKQLKSYVIIMFVLSVLSFCIPTSSGRDLFRGNELINNKIPKNIGKWDSIDRKLEDYYFKELGTNDLLMRTYRHKGTDKKIYLFMVHSRNNWNAFHDPEICLKGDGYKLIEKNDKILHDNIFNALVHRMLFKRKGKRLLVYYWYYVNGEIIKNPLAFHWLFSFGSGRSSGGIMIRLSKVIDPENTDSGEKNLEQFALEAIPVLKKVL